MAQDWLVLQLTDNNGFYLGLVTAIQFVPVMLLSLHGWVLADRVDKRKLLIATNTLAALACYALDILAVAEITELWLVFVCAAVLGIASAIDAPIRQSFTAEIVGDSDVAYAVSLNSANFNAGRLIGPGLSGILIANLDTGPSLLINATSYLFVIGSLFFMRSSDFLMHKKEGTLGTVRLALINMSWWHWSSSPPPLSSLFIGYMTETVGVRETIFICGVIPLIAVTLLWVFFKDKLQKPDDLRASTILKG